eukprot:Skav232609  [mRNA]  locus=scaffold1224:438431:439183:+ [translate_table: standard]
MLGEIFRYSWETDVKSWSVQSQDILITRGQTQRQQNCSIVDLRSWKWREQDLPVSFYLCGAAGGNSAAGGQYIHFYLWSNNKWQYFHTLEDGMYTEYKLQRQLVGWNFGYGIDMNDSYQVQYSFQTPYRGDRSIWCSNESWVWLGNLSGAERTVALGIVIADHWVKSSQIQGIVPQLFKLFGNLGGFLALLTIIFTRLFVKKHPDSEVARVYDARTFLGDKIGLPLAASKDEAAPRPALPPGLFKGLERE